MDTENRKGFALIFALTITILIVFVAGAFFITAYNDLAMADAITNSIRAYYLSDAGLAKKFMELRSGSTSAITGETFTYASGSSGSFSVAVTQVSGGVFSVYRLDSTGVYKGRSKISSLTLKRISCARFGYFSNYENQLYWWWTQPVWFVTGDLLQGPVHTNDQLNIYGDPVFDGPVSSVSDTINYYHGGPPEDNPDFVQSLTLGAPSIQLPTTTDIVNTTRAAAQQADGVYLTGNTQITLVSNGTMNVTNSNKGWVNQNMTLPANNALFVDNGYVDISGTLNGQLTVGTNNNIFVVNNLLYNNDPRVDPSSTDILGLVSQNNVYVDSSAPYNVEIDAYIVALNTSFGVDNYNYGLKGLLTILGGITQYRRGPVGTFNSTTGERISGYTKDYQYDARLSNIAPAYFPPAKDSNNRIVYVKVLWTEN